LINFIYTARFSSLMKYTLSALDLHFLVSEMQELISAKVEKIYQPEKHDFLFVFHVPNAGKRFLRITLPNSMFMTDFKGEIPEQPLQFCIFLRKQLSNARLREISQLGFERIVKFLFETKDSKFRLYVELFSTGNVILCDEQDMIRSALVTKKWKDRTVRGNVKYEYPMRDHDLLKMDEEEFLGLVRDSDKDSIVKTLALDLGLGGKYAEELCQRAGIDKTISKPDPVQVKKLFSEISKLRKEKIKAGIIMKGTKTVDVVPVAMKSYESYGVNLFNTFSEALGKVLTEKVIDEQKTRAEEKHSRELRKYEKMISEQEETIAGLEKSISENQRKGELIFERYSEVSGIMTELKKARKKYSWKEIREKLKGHITIKEINEKEKKIVVELGD